MIWVCLRSCFVVVWEGLTWMLMKGGKDRKTPIFTCISPSSPCSKRCFKIYRIAYHLSPKKRDFFNRHLNKKMKVQSLMIFLYWIFETLNHLYVPKKLNNETIASWRRKFEEIDTFISEDSEIFLFNSNWTRPKTVRHRQQQSLELLSSVLKKGWSKQGYIDHGIRSKQNNPPRPF